MNFKVSADRYIQIKIKLSNLYNFVFLNLTKKKNFQLK